MKIPSYKVFFSYLLKGTHHFARNGAPPDKFGILYRVLHIEFRGFNSRIDVSELSHFGSWY